MCYKKPGDVVDAGERVGLMKFGSRIDVFLGPEWEVSVEAGRARVGWIERDRSKENRMTARSPNEPQSLRDRLVDPRSPDRRPRRAAYALPTLFTAGNVFLGFYALMEIIPRRDGDGAERRGGAPHHFQNAAIAMRMAVFFDGLDGRIARMTNTVSEFGSEMDSLADFISFGIAPAVLAFAWGVQFVDPYD